MTVQGQVLKNIVSIVTQKKVPASAFCLNKKKNTLLHLFFKKMAWETIQYFFWP